MAEGGLTEDDLRKMVGKLESSVRDQYGPSVGLCDCGLRKCVPVGTQSRQPPPLVFYRSEECPTMRPSARGCRGPRPIQQFGAGACRLFRLQLLGRRGYETWPRGARLGGPNLDPESPRRRLPQQFDRRRITKEPTKPAAS
jgi:hypothetical protein